VSDQQQEKFEQRAQSLLTESAEHLDARTRSRLTQARHAALEAVKPAQKGVWKWLVPVSGATATAVIGAVLLFNPGRYVEQGSAVAAADELEIVTGEDSLEFYRDVEFYAWLDTVLDDAPAEESGA
jgi:hypothetical protein